MASAALFHDIKSIWPTGPVPVTSYDDPLDRDERGDVAVLATRRSLSRVALIAAETASRFAREAQPHDPMAWMLAPRRLFGGASALEACLDRDNCERALVLHGLSIGLDADPEDIDGLRDGGAVGAGGDEDFVFGHGYIAANDGDSVAGPAAIDGITFPRRPYRLFSATITVREPDVDIIAFHASYAMDHGQVVERLTARFGAELASRANVRTGFDPNHPLLPPEVVKALLKASDDGSGSDDMIDISFERRILR